MSGPIVRLAMWSKQDPKKLSNLWVARKTINYLCLKLVAKLGIPRSPELIRIFSTQGIIKLIRETGLCLASLQLARVGHQTARQTAERIAGTELGRSVATVSDADIRPGHPGWRWQSES